MLAVVRTELTRGGERLRGGGEVNASGVNIDINYCNALLPLFFAHQPYAPLMHALLY